MTDFVDRTLREWRQSPFIWGETDCLLSIGAYSALVTGVDHTAQFRGRYDDEQGAYRLIRDHDGEDALIDLLGHPRTDEPARGDILLLDLERPLAALCTGDGAAARMMTGVIEVRLKFVRILAAWKVL